MAQYLELLENPRRRRRRSRHNPNIVGFDEFGNPITVGGYKSSMGRSNIMRRNRRRNPARALAMPATVREWTQGVDLMDAGAAVGGLAMSTMLPGVIVKVTDTTGQKVWKLVIALGAAFGAGAIGRAMISPSAGKAAVIGGIAGAAAQGLGMFTGINIGRKMITGSRTRLGETTIVSPSTSPGGEQTGIIIP